MSMLLDSGKLCEFNSYQYLCFSLVFPSPVCTLYEEKHVCPPALFGWAVLPYTNTQKWKAALLVTAASHAPTASLKEWLYLPFSLCFNEDRWCVCG